MRIHLKKDNSIDREMLDKAMEAIADVFEKQTGIEVEWDIENRWFEHYKWDDYGGYLAMNRDMISAEAMGMRRAEGLKYDILLFAVEDENWKPEKIWGVNLSNTLAGFHTTQARVDNDSKVNTQGTIYHEIMHTIDQTIYNMTGIDIEQKILAGHDFDDCVVHGECEEFEYIRYKENNEILAQIKDELRKAYDLRERIYNMSRGKLTDKVKAMFKNITVSYRKRKWGKNHEDIPTPKSVAEKMGKIIENERS